MPVARALPRLCADGRRFALVFADPPYAVEAVADVVRGVGEGGLLAEGGTLVVEHGRREVRPRARWPGCSGWTRAGSGTRW